MGMITYQTLRQLRRNWHQLILEVVDHDLHAVVEHIEVGLLGQLEKRCKVRSATEVARGRLRVLTLDDFANLGSHSLLDWRTPA